MQVTSIIANYNLVPTLPPRQLTGTLLFVDLLLPIRLALAASYSHALPAIVLQLLAIHSESNARTDSPSERFISPFPCKCRLISLSVQHTRIFGLGRAMEHQRKRKVLTATLLHNKALSTLFHSSRARLYQRQAHVLC
jgi:hypothetical protein